jgi:hypothetical protein
MIKEEELGDFRDKLKEMWPNSLFLSTTVSTYEPMKCQNPGDRHLIYLLLQLITKLGDYYNNKYNDMPQWKFLRNAIMSSLFIN